MRLNTKTRYAVRAMLTLALREQEVSLSAPAILLRVKKSRLNTLKDCLARCAQPAWFAASAGHQAVTGWQGLRQISRCAKFIMFSRARRALSSARMNLESADAAADAPRRLFGMNCTSFQCATWKACLWLTWWCATTVAKRMPNV